MKDRERQRAAGSVASEESDLLLDSEVREQVEAEMQRQMAGWVHQKIPALGGLTPIEAVADRTAKKSWKPCCWTGSAKTKDPQVRERSAPTSTPSDGNSISVLLSSDFCSSFRTWI